MASFNRVILVGNLTRDIEVRYVSNGGMAVTELGLAVNDRRKNQSGEWVDETTFVDVTLWGRTAEIASEYLSKGSSVLIEGRLKLDTWETDGQKRSKLRVVGEKMQMLGGREGGSGGGGNRGGSRPPQRQSQPQGGGGYNQGGSSDYDSYDDGSFGGRGSQGAADDDIPF
ncbi:single-stranded DNA-binding protein [Blastopirellula marina]|uniref:Single-stranded DNA-binding protein n=1 Tax=Blastopirellula marina TaxID=124 RepID=A0A2S8F7B8_9BACT|nr:MULTISPECIES: single-stranded DNA-binding protein [Pirellulaceae]PQO28046.1 single-stranded DNA-binding protein [Blastopirellula marina]RCS48471.1 single-stranded DNA-binding protein [Bremerella cremea]